MSRWFLWHSLDPVYRTVSGTQVSRIYIPDARREKCSVHSPCDTPSRSVIPQNYHGIKVWNKPFCLRMQRIHNEYTYKLFAYLQHDLTSVTSMVLSLLHFIQGNCDAFAVFCSLSGVSAEWRFKCTMGAWGGVALRSGMEHTLWYWTTSEESCLGLFLYPFLFFVLWYYDRVHNTGMGAGVGGLNPGICRCLLSYRLGLSDIFPLSGISGLSFGSPFLFPLWFFYR